MSVSISFRDVCLRIVSIRAIKSTHLSFSTTAQNEMAIPRCRRLTSRLQGIPTLVLVTKVEWPTQSKRGWFVRFTSWLQCRDERKQLHPSPECTFYQFIHGPRTSWHGCTAVFWTGARTRGIVVCLFLQIAVLKFSGMHKHFSWSVHCMVQFSIPAETTIIIGYSGMREPNPGWCQQEKTRVNSRKFKPAGRPFAQREALLVFSWFVNLVTTLSFAVN